MSALTKRLIILTAAVTAAGLAGCGDNPADTIPGGGDPENISKVTVNLTPVGGGAAISVNRRDPDGTQLPQPVGAASGTITLKIGTTYNGTVDLLNDIDPNNVVNISDEVDDEANFHRFFYTLTCPGVTVPEAGLNRDTQNPTQPFGRAFQLVVAANAPTTASCTLNVQLHHFETNKGDGAGSNFETDLDIDFPASVQP
jgi:hypothetical protein